MLQNASNTVCHKGDNNNNNRQKKKDGWMAWKKIRINSPSMVNYCPPIISIIFCSVRMAILHGCRHIVNSCVHVALLFSTVIGISNTRRKLYNNRILLAWINTNPTIYTTMMSGPEDYMPWLECEIYKWTVRNADLVIFTRHTIFFYVSRILVIEIFYFMSKAY